MKIITAKQAAAMTKMRRLIDPENRHYTRRFDKGKYTWTGTIRDYVGKEVPDLPGVVAVYASQRMDKWGPFVVLMSVCNDEEK